MGEDKNNIFTVGCPSLDALRLEPEINIDKLSKKFKINFRKKFLCVLQHPVTTEKESSKKQILETDGLLATCIQHEMDHLEGILFIDYLSKLKKTMIVKKLSKQKEKPDRIIV